MPSLPITRPPTGASAPLATLLRHAAAAVKAVRAGRSLDDALAEVPGEARAGTQAIAFHALRRLGASAATLKALAAKPPKGDIEALLLVALALAWPAEHADEGEVYAEHTIVDQAVGAAQRMQPAAAGFVNALLRRFLREREAFVARAQDDPVARHNLPRWWIDRVRRDWPAEADRVLAQSHRAPPMTLRVNLQRTTVDAYRRRLADAGLAAEPLPPALDAPAALRLVRPCPVAMLPGFAEGLVSVQDAAAQRAAPLLLDGLPRGAGLRVLDACAAPGGKTAHLLEVDPTLRVTALDDDAERLDRVRTNLARLGLAAEVIAGDAARPATWWDGQPFDAALVDAPCSGSGVVRRHPDIAWLRRNSDVAKLATTQSEVLRAVAGMMKKSGRILYATCSIFKEEGETRIGDVLAESGAGGWRADPASPGHLLPLPDNSHAVAAHDGFFYARLLHG